jgi:hypothetical protein
MNLEEMKLFEEKALDEKNGVKYTNR